MLFFLKNNVDHIEKKTWSVMNPPTFRLDQQRKISPEPAVFCWQYRLGRMFGHRTQYGPLKNISGRRSSSWKFEEFAKRIASWSIVLILKFDRMLSRNLVFTTVLKFFLDGRVYQPIRPKNHHRVCNIVSYCSSTTHWERSGTALFILHKL